MQNFGRGMWRRVSDYQKHYQQQQQQQSTNDINNNKLTRYLQMQKERAINAYNGLKKTEDNKTLVSKEKENNMLVTIISEKAILSEMNVLNDNVLNDNVLNEAISENYVVVEAINEPYVAVVTEPVVTEPVVTEPVVTEEVVTEPVVTEPVVTEPVVTEEVVVTNSETAVATKKKRRKNK